MTLRDIRRTPAMRHDGPALRAVQKLRKTQPQVGNNTTLRCLSELIQSRVSPARQQQLPASGNSLRQRNVVLLPTQGCGISTHGW
jgi:hypothetical protein